MDLAYLVLLAPAVTAVGALVLLGLMLRNQWREDEPEFAEITWLQARVIHGCKVVVHLVDDSSYNAQLLNVDSGGLVLEDVKPVEANLPIAGDCWVPLDQVRMLQVL